MQRRRSRLVAAVAAGVALLYLLVIEPRRLRVTRWRVRIDGLPLAHEGLRLVHLSDLHLGMWLASDRHLRRAVSAAVAARPDLIVLTGDLTHHGRRPRSWGLFQTLVGAAPTFAVLGNHDHASGDDATNELVTGLRDRGVRVLMNEHAECGVPGLPWLMVGIDDWATGHSDLIKAVTGIVPYTRVLALLTHVPDVADGVPQGWFPLVLAGHTHGIRLRAGPLNALPWVRRRMAVMRTRFPRGFYAVNGALLYVSRGVGVSELPVRAGSLPEVSILELTSGVSLPPSVRYRRLG